LFWLKGADFMAAIQIENNEKNLKGLIVQIQGSSFVDGPGIRTTIFLKGCPLRCKWCCNPETQEMRQEENKLFPEKGAGKTFGQWLSVEEVMQTVQKDLKFYRSSGGGVTVAGGEPSFQPAFALEVIKRCKELQIHTALDTCGYTINEQAEKVLENVDMLLYDLKIMDPAGHEQYTGLKNDRILNNLRRMAQSKKDIVIRIPLIPGITDTAQNIIAIGDFLNSLGKGSIKQVDLLAYHLGGLTKYEMLGRDYPMDKSLKPQSEERLQEIKQTLTSVFNIGCPVYLGGG
jgi:pyruvate formate lyase activating enzyme